MPGAKILITGLANSGKTSLLKSLENCLVVSRDGKPFSLPLPHFNVPDFTDINEMLGLVDSKIEAYKDKFGEYPRTIAFDSVSRIFSDIETNCSRRFSGFDIWKHVNSEIDTFVDYINSILSEDVNIILIAHAVWDEKAGKFVETCKGSFAKTGGFLSTVDYAINIDVKGKKREITHRGIGLARTLLDDLPDKQDVSEFNLQDYVNKIAEKTNEVAEQWSL